MAAMQEESTQRGRSTASERVRASRDGDRFHYTWGAAQLLQLLSPASRLQQVTVEGADSTSSREEPDGSEIIDLTEFYGPTEGNFTSLEVRQFKHSTLRSNENFTLGEVCKVFSKFAELDGALCLQYPDAIIRYSIVTNKPIAQVAIDSVRELATGMSPKEGSPAAKLQDAAKLTADALASLCSRIDLLGREPGITALRRGLDREVGGLTADVDLRVSASLIDLVASRASTETSGPITRADILTAFGCREDDLAPAPCLIDKGDFIERDAYRDLADHILKTTGSTIVTAEGGVGKSTFARVLPDLLSDCADVIIYDCFGNGNYRNPAHPRHRHRDGLVQLATELAGLGLCFPIIHTGNLAPEEYTKAFVRRLAQASEMLIQRQRQLVIVVDAADNAVIAAEDNADSRSFVRDLLRLECDIPRNIHIVLTCRPERLDRLEAPVGTFLVQLPAFTLEESTKFVTDIHSSATDSDITEIHDRTAGNPRVMSTVLLESATIYDALSRLSGLSSATSALDLLMQRKVAKAFNNAGKSRIELERVSQLLTLLRPSIPLEVLAELADTHVASVRSFISDLGQGLILNGQTVQFLDEPTETYFRTSHPATREVATQVASQLRALSSSSAYAASSLPEVLWSAQLYDELLDLVATDDGLPSTSDVERTQVEHLRVEFGLRAAVRLHRSDSIVQLSMRAGAGRSGKGRQFTIIRDNPDLAGSWMDARVLGELIASRELPESWPGSTLGAEAALLAHTTGGVSAARSRARQAASTMAAWVHAPRERYSQIQNIAPDQVAHIALAMLRTDGPASAARYLSDWSPAHFVIESSATLARMLISSARDKDVSDLIVSATCPSLLFGVLGEMQRVGMTLDEHIIGDLWKMLKLFDSPLTATDFDHQKAEDIAFRGIAWICALAVRHSVVDASVAAERLCGCLPSSLPLGLGDRYSSGRLGLLFAIALRAELMGEVLDVSHYRPVEAPPKRGRHDAAKSNDKNLDHYLRPALNWLSTWAKYACGDLDPKTAVEVIESYPKSLSQDEVGLISNRIARQVLPLVGVAFTDEAVTVACNQAIQAIATNSPIAGALDLISGLRGDTRFELMILDLSNAAHDELFNTAEVAESRAETLVRIARGLYRFSPDEAKSYFDQAVKVASGVGDDAIHRWNAIVALTRAAAGIDPQDALILAERIARLSEAVKPIVHDNFNQHELVAALTLISNTSIFRILGQWRDRRFGTLESQFSGLFDEDDSLFVQRPDLTIILAPFSTHFRLSDSLRELDASDDLNAKTLSTVNNLAKRFGRSLDDEFTQSLLPDPPRAKDSNKYRSTIFDLTPDQQAKRNMQIEQCRTQISQLDLTKTRDVDAAIRLQKDARTYSENLFIAEVFNRPMLQWGPILDATSSSDCISEYEFAKLLNEALTRPRKSQSFVKSLKNAVGTYVARHGAFLVQHKWVSFNLHSAADLLEVHTTDLLQRALEQLNLEEALTNADNCYMLAAGASKILDSPTAARILDEALIYFEEELNVCPEAAIEQMPADPINVAVANFIWAALGDPRSAVRWQAAHAVRTAIELSVSDVLDALGSAVVRGDAAGYADERFLFYEMSAAEWFLVAVERVARDDPSAIDSLFSAVIELSDRYPDHAMIQSHCASIAELTGRLAGRSVGTDWKSKLAEPMILENWRRNSHPRPMMHGAPKAEYRFDFDFDDYVLGKLTKAFDITHQEVLNATSVLILDEWGFRNKGKHLEDPRRTASVYQDGETYGFKWETPKAESLDYYLERHAALTIAGRLMRTAIPYREPDAEQPDVVEWLADFDIARYDGRWITDQRSSVPGSLAAVGPRGSNQNLESEFLAALKPADGWVTIWQSASAADYDRTQRIDIASALVNSETAGALVRALQTADSYMSFRIPSADLDDEDFQFSSPPFELRGWVSIPYSEGGIDRLDSLATGLAPELPRPSSDIVEMLSIISAEGGLRWENEGGDSILASESWAEFRNSLEQDGSSGYRLRITTEALDMVLKRLDVSLIVEVQVRREDRRTRYIEDPDHKNEGGNADHGNDFRVFSYRPGTGWNDFKGHIETG
ncbi:hypothetical protein YH66_00340 [[Brevibacterium] flavum]|uniref:Uncharacterized protein n=1 Tax=[Brevibacterium] flavum TaxID=92706 RepID=A0A0F6Z3H2_9CORY|nr:hypothetical protein YH66_00340 [[Brevibacterium] flavum]ANE06942.1 hypothetical protein A3654_00330 [Corynebacterium glutamicum]AST19348.1 hypothetical protein CEY17_00335 [Corynebacterium glutamicum ATCC 14067]KEI21789.1 hypothetical protein KIQ_004110 [Corynebacterium glutamicum ATCC 14067]KIH75091.1 hypothetical protein SD36_00465 [Corynebacterium glutamicum]